MSRKRKKMTVEVVYGLPHRQVLLSLEVAPGATALEAVRKSGIDRYFPELDVDSAKMGIFSQIIADPTSHKLESGDRVEIYRPLIIDPKEARRRRVSGIRARSRRADS